jgi:alpha-L-arabinofuranosidase
MPSTAEVDLEQRIHTVAEWVLGGVRYSELLAKCYGEWRVCKRTAESYVAKANELARASRMRQKEVMIARAAEKLERIHDRALAREDCAAATGAVRELIKLLGLAEPDKQEVKHGATDALEAFLGKLVNNPDEPKPV